MAEEKIISKEQIAKVAELARIELSSEERIKFSDEIASVLDFFKNINELDLENVKEFDHYNLTKNETRTDAIVENKKEEKDLIKNNFPSRKDDHLSVKAVL